MSLGGSIKLKGESEYTRAIKNITNNLKVLSSEMKIVTNEYGKNDTSVEGLTKAYSKMTQILNDQKAKVSQMQNEYSRMLEQVKLNTQAHDKLAKEYQDEKAKLDEYEQTLGKTSQEYQDQEKIVKNYSKALKDSEKNQDANAKALLDYNVKMNNAKADVAKTENAVKDLSQRLEEAKNPTKEMGNAIEDAGENARHASDGFSVMKGVLANLATDALRKVKDGFKNLIQAGIDYESSFTNVEKTVDGTAEQLDKLNTDIRQMAKEMPQSASAIAEVASSAGQLGIKTDDIASFTKTMIMLGDATNLSSEEASSALAKFANVTKMSANDYSKLGSTIVALGNNFATTEADIVNMGTRLASAGTQIGLTQAQIMSIATALSSVGLEAEAGGTAFSKLMINMQVACENGGDTLEEFANVSNMTASEFKEAFEQDATKAIQAFLAGLGDTERNGKSAIGVLSDMGIEEVRLRDTILRATQAKDVFNSAIELGNKAWQEDVALSNEATKRYQTTASKIQIMKNNFIDLGITLFNKFQPQIQKAIDGLTKLANSEKGIKTLTKAVGLLVGAFAVTKILTFTKTLSSMLTTMKLVATGAKVFSATMGTLVTATTGATTATGLLTSAVNLLKYAWATNPIGVALTAVAGLTAVVYGLVKASKESANAQTEEAKATKALIDKQNELNKSIAENKTARQEAIKDAEVQGQTAQMLAERIDALSKVENKTNAEKSTMKELINQLNEIMPNLNLQYDEEADKLNMSTEALKNNVTAQQEYMKAKVAQEELANITKDIVELELQRDELIQQQTDNYNAYAEAQKKVQEFEEKYGVAIYDTNSYIYAQYRALVSLRDQAYNTYQESVDAVNNNKQAVKDLNAEYDKTQKYAENMYSQAEITQKINALTELAKAQGIEIPKALADGMRAGNYVVPESVEDLNKLIAFDTALQNAGLAGANIPTSISANILNGKASVEEAIAQVNQAIQFNQALTKAQESGYLIPENLAENVKNGKISVDDAMTQLNSWIQFNQALATTSASGWRIPENLKENILSGKTSVEEANDALNSWIQFTKATQVASIAGANIPANLKDGINNNSYVAIRSISGLNAEMGKEAGKVSTILNQQGQNGGTNLVTGLKAGTDNPYQRSLLTGSVSSLANDMIWVMQNTFQTHSPSKVTEGIGINFLQGMRNGIDNRNSRSSIFNAVASFGSNLLNSLKDVLGIHSPSKKTEDMAKQLLAGYDVGLNKNEGKTLKKYSNFGVSLADSLNTGLNSTSIELNKLHYGKIKSSLNGNMSEENQALLINSFKTALSDMKIELDDEVAGKFVEKTIARAIYS